MVFTQNTKWSDTVWYLYRSKDGWIYVAIPAGVFLICLKLGIYCSFLAKRAKVRRLGWFKCPCRCSCSASALHNQSLCASEEGSGTQYTEKKGSSAGTVEWVLTCYVLAWEGSSIHLCYVSFFSTVPIKAGQRPLSAGGTALPAVGGCCCASVKVTPPLVGLYALLMDSWQLTNLQSKSLSCSLLAKKVIK